MTERPELTRRPEAVLIDLAGVLHVGDIALPGAVDALARLREAGFKLRFLTNTTRSPRSAIRITSYNVCYTKLLRCTPSEPRA